MALGSNRGHGQVKLLGAEEGHFSCEWWEKLPSGILGHFVSLAEEFWELL